MGICYMYEEQVKETLTVWHAGGVVALLRDLLGGAADRLDIEMTEACRFD
ncbi:MAG: hypothetical protein KZQ88_11580 [Candidatus Thiodiazotropha sp. (ex Dulcina madagascariensis)]|nr:hypothetical protein [Candidatus Thiodiazotropha sp. (ex Dulcina madagascariensis)]MCU7928084.1 hypothetical protein [Candidatus Thiodiazotropha sp. (ex Dulcina madagascariensis)]